MSRGSRNGTLNKTPTRRLLMNRLMIVARLVEGAPEDAEPLIAHAPPFAPDDLGFHRHAAYLTAGEVVFLFEGLQVEWILNDVVDDTIVAETVGPGKDV